MRLTILLTLAVAALVTMLTSACEHTGTELGKQLGCHLAGNACESVNMDDPNLRGAAGSAGATGPMGLAGERGLPGLGESFTTVRFCHQPSTYPTVFAEYGICLSGQLYAVYSPTATLVLIPPGRYTSASVGSTCNFTVLPNCGVKP